jgi:hypothetical protein
VFVLQDRTRRKSHLLFFPQTGSDNRTFSCRPPPPKILRCGALLGSRGWKRVCPRVNAKTQLSPVGLRFTNRFEKLMKCISPSLWATPLSKYPLSSAPIVWNAPITSRSEADLNSAIIGYKYLLFSIR